MQSDNAGDNAFLASYEKLAANCKKKTLQGWQFIVEIQSGLIERDFLLLESVHGGLLSGIQR